MRRAGQALDFQLPSGAARQNPHLAQQMGTEALLKQRPEAYYLVGHRWSLVRVKVWQPNPTEDPR
jgi:hypothetical protein